MSRKVLSLRFRHGVHTSDKLHGSRAKAPLAIEPTRPLEVSNMAHLGVPSSFVYMRNHPAATGDTCYFRTPLSSPILLELGAGSVYGGSTSRMILAIRVNIHLAVR